MSLSASLFDKCTRQQKQIADLACALKEILSLASNTDLDYQDAYHFLKHVQGMESARAALHDVEKGTAIAAAKGE